MIPLRTQAELETKAALEGVLAALEGAPLGSELTLVPMRIYGDALRLGLEAPRRLRAWAGEASPALLDDVLRAGVALLREVGPRARKDAEDPSLATKLRERDHVESVLTAVRRVWLPRPLTQLEAYPLLIERLGGWDRAAGDVVSRGAATLLLGVRAALGAAWLQRYPDEDSVTRDDDGDLLAVLRGTRPSLATVMRYVEGGVMRDVVEGAATEDAEFADELADTIEGMRAVGQASLAARAWLKGHEAGAFTFAAPPLAHAAASGDDASAPVVHRLGTLFVGLDAEARLVVSGREITLELDFDPGAIAHVELGAERATPSANATSCRLVVARSAVNVRFRVRASTGQEVEEELLFQTDAP